MMPLITLLREAAAAPPPLPRYGDNAIDTPRHTVYGAAMPPYASFAMLLY